MVSRKKMVKIYLVNKYANGLVSKVNFVKMLGDNWWYVNILIVCPNIED